MKIHGLQKMTLLDYPGRVACTVFFGGCEMRCPFCHNAELLDGSAPAVMTNEELIAFLENNLQADGSVRIPEVLRPYMGGKELLIPKKA